MNASGAKTLSELIRLKARKVGFDLIGIARSRILNEHEAFLRQWSESGMNSDMKYLGQNIEKRINPELLYPGTRSVIVTGLNYYTETKQGGNGVPIISRYAYGTNYHDVITGKLNKIIEYIKVISPGSSCKTFVDSAPILEKAWGREAGLGWPGKHSVLINRNIGSFFFLGIILTDIELDYDEPHYEDFCGTCRICIESCPTGAINNNRTIDTRHCIAYLTIECKVPFGKDKTDKLGGRIFGCDICQEICPWNKKLKPHKTSEFEIPSEVRDMTIEDWKNLTKEQFTRLFGKSAVGRRNFDIFKENVTNVTFRNNQ